MARIVKDVYIHRNVRCTRCKRTIAKGERTFDKEFICEGCGGKYVHIRSRQMRYGGAGVALSTKQYEGSFDFSPKANAEFSAMLASL